MVSFRTKRLLEEIEKLKEEIKKLEVELAVLVTKYGTLETRFNDKDVLVEEKINKALEDFSKKINETIIPQTMSEEQAKQIQQSYLNVLNQYLFGPTKENGGEPL